MLQFAVHGRAISTLLATHVRTRCELHELFNCMIYSKSSMFSSWFGSSFLEPFFLRVSRSNDWCFEPNRPYRFDLNRLQRSPFVLEVDMRRQQVKDDQNVLSDQTKLRRHGGGQCVSRILGRDIPNTLAGNLFPRWFAKYPVAQWLSRAKVFTCRSAWTLSTNILQCRRCTRNEHPP